jgi:hypothetical protein
MSKFTPGPWEIWKLYEQGVSEPNTYVADVGGIYIVSSQPLGSIVADANLIAAAPEMYEALKPFANLECPVEANEPDSKTI